MTIRGNRLLWTNIILVVVGSLDLASTVFWLQTHRMVEDNPVMASVLRLGMPVFILAKLATLAAFVLVIETYRKRNAVLARLASRFTLLAYLGIYGVSFFSVNHKFLLG